MNSPSIYVAENYIYKDKSYTGSFPIYLRDACQVIPPIIPVNDLVEDRIMLAAEENTSGSPRIINSETSRQGVLYRV